MCSDQVAAGNQDSVSPAKQFDLAQLADVGSFETSSTFSLFCWKMASHMAGLLLPGAPLAPKPPLAMPERDGVFLLFLSSTTVLASAKEP